MKYFLFAPLLILTFCTPKSDGQTGHNFTQHSDLLIINEDSLGDREVVNYSEIFEDFTLVPLEVTENSRLSIIKQVVKSRVGYDLDGLELVNRNAESVTSLNYKGIYAISNYFETDRFFSFKYHTGRTSFVSVYYDKQDEIASRRLLIDDLVEGGELFTFIKTDVNGHLYKTIDLNTKERIDRVKGLISKNSFSFMSSDIKNRLLDLDMNSNPVLAFYKLKEEYQ